MRLNSILKFASFLGLAGYVNCAGFKMTFFGETANDRPSVTAIPACGIDGVDLETEYFIAMNHEQYDETKRNPANPNTASVCGKCIKVVYKNKWIVGKVVDRCPKLDRGGLDVSPAIFEYFESADEGVIFMDWEYTDCSLLGKRGTCSDGKCTATSSGASSGSSSKPKEETKSSEVKSKTSSTSSKKASTVKSKTTVQEAKPTDATEPKQDKAEPKQDIDEPKQSQKSKSKENKGTKSDSKDDDKAEGPALELDSATAEQKEGGNSYVVPLTGALFVSGAAGVALIYAKRENRLTDLKEKFPEAFNNIKRSISRGSSQIRRGLSQSGKAISRGSSQLRRSLSQSGRAISRGSSQLRRSLSQSRAFRHSKKGQNGVNPLPRTKREYRNSLNAHYPLNNQASNDGYNVTANQIYYKNYYDDGYYNNGYYNDGYYNNDIYYNNSYEQGYDNNYGYDNTNYEENPYVYQFNAYDEFEDVQTDFVDNRK